MRPFEGNGHDDERTIDRDSATRRGGLCRVFVSYARADEEHRVRLDVHLAPLKREGLIDLWSDRVIAPGADWERDIERELATADIVILLVTPDFVASMYCFEKELSEALRRHDEDGVRILPVLVKPVDLQRLPFSRFQGLPLDLRPISTWADADDAWLEVARGVRGAVEGIYRDRTNFPAQRNGELAGTVPLLRQSEIYYGSQNCVIDGRGTEIEWIPLNEDSDDRRFENLVPVNRRHRSRTLRFMTGTLQRATFRFGIDLIAENLFHSARKHFHVGFPALAFGCTRLGDVLASHYPHNFEAHEGDDWLFLAQSLFYLPYRMHAALLNATLLRVRRRLTFNNNCPNAGRAALLLAVANLLQDLGKWAKAEELYDEILSSRPAPFIQVATIRRRAVGRIFRGATRQAMERDFRRVGDYETTADLAVSLAISQGWWHLAQGRPRECLRLLEPFEDDDAAHSVHNAIELRLTQASALIALGLSCVAQLRFLEERAGGVNHLRPVFTEYVAPLILSRQLTRLVEAFGAPTVSSPLLDDTADALVAARGTTVAGRPIWVD